MSRLARHSASKPPNQLETRAPRALRDLRFTDHATDVSNQPRSIALSHRGASAWTFPKCPANGRLRHPTYHPRPSLHLDGPRSATLHVRTGPLVRSRRHLRRARGGSLAFSIVKSNFATIAPICTSAAHPHVTGQISRRPHRASAGLPSFAKARAFQ